MARGLANTNGARDFSTKAAAVIATAEKPTGGRHRKYPRKISVDGTPYQVQSLYEEKALLRAIQERREEAALKLEAKGQPERAQQVRKTVIRLKKRIARVEVQQLDRIRQEDEEILLLMVSDPWL